MNLIQIKCKKLALVIAICLMTMFVPGKVFSADSTGNLEGFVYDKDDKTPVANVSVILVQTLTGKEFHAVTDSFGVYKLPTLPAGDFKVRLKVKDNVYKVNTIVKIEAGSTKSASFSLKDAEKKKAFLTTPLGIALIAASTAGVGVLAYELLVSATEK